MTPTSRQRARSLPVLVASLLAAAVLLGPYRAHAGTGTLGPEKCRVQHGGYVASDHKTIYTSHQAYCLSPARTSVTVSSRTYRNGALVTSRTGTTCNAGTYGSGLCKGKDSMTWRNSARDVICIQTRVDFVIDGRRQNPDLDTSCVTWHSDSATYSRLGPLDVGGGCEPATLHFPLGSQVQARHLGRCSDKVKKVTMDWFLSRNSSYDNIAAQTPYRSKPCTPSSAVAFSCTSTTGITNTSGSHLYCAVVAVQWEYRVASNAPRDFTKSCWYF